jgi:DMSO reductase anchor subunit
MNAQKTMRLCCAILWVIAAICFLLCAITNFAAGAYATAILYMVTFSIDGLSTIFYFIQWYRLRKLIKEIKKQ